MIKKIKLKIDKRLKYFNIINILRINGIFLFHQNLLLDIESNWNLNNLFLNKNYIWKFLRKEIIKKTICNKFYHIIKNFRNILIIKNINELNEIEQLLIKNNNIILGYYIKKIFFFKKDWDIKKIEKEIILEKIKKKKG